MGALSGALEATVTGAAPSRPLSALLLPAALAGVLTACGPATPSGSALEGRYWDVEAGEFIDFPTLVDRLADHDHILVGEQHDHPGHHRLQGRLVQALADRGQRRALVAEMFDAEDEAALEGLRNQPPREVGAVARAVTWDGSGWPDFSLYEPLFAATLEAGWPLHAGNPDRPTTMDVHRDGFAALGADIRARLALEEEPPGDVMEALRGEVREAHCDHGTADLFRRQARVQFLRDAWMARRLQASATGDGTLLVAGTGHVRPDHAVPFHLQRQGADGSAVTLQLRPTPEAGMGAAEAAADGPPANFIAFTRRRGPTDPCAAYREALEEMGGHGPVE
ncbi:MAG: ChaN family lipoprotein [Pseudomonadota bacterium]